MPTWIRLCGLSLVVLAAMAADSGQELFERVRAKVLDNARRTPRYTCVQTINRAEYASRGGYVTWHDRLRLDVAVLDGRETFSWAGAQQFETTDLRQLIPSGSAGSGDFASFLATVFGLPASEISLLGRDLFGYRVPVNRSGYRYQSRGSGPERVTAYHGTILVDAANAELKRLTVVADEFPPSEPVREVRDVMDYQRVGDFLLPARSVMIALFSNGKESHNETTYANCREYKGESTIRFEDAPEESAVEAKTATRKLPSHVKLQLGLKEPIDSDTAAAGDPVTAVVLRDAKGIKAGETVHGRIVRLEQSLFPSPKWVVAFQMEGMRPLKDTFTFAERGRLVLDSKFRSEWETR